MIAKVSIFWDYENISFRGPRRNSEFFQKVLAYGGKIGKVQNFHIYGVSEGQIYEGLKPMAKRYQAKLIPVEARFKNALDRHLVFDCVTILGSNSPPNIVVLVAGDGDYRPLVKCLQASDVKVTVIARKGSMNDGLRRLTNKLILIPDFMRVSDAA